MKSFLLVLGLLAVTCSACFAQSLCRFGIGTPLLAKANMAFGSKMKSSPFICSGVDLVLQVNGYDEQAISFFLLAGLEYDAQSFRISGADRIISERYFANINPSVLIPSKWEKLKYNVGVGTLVAVGQSVGTSSYNGTIATFYADVDSLADQLEHYSRKIVPFISLGLVFEPGKHFKLQFLLQQTLMGSYETGAKISYWYSYYDRREFAISYLPLYGGLRFLYLF